MSKFNLSHSVLRPGKIWKLIIFCSCQLTLGFLQGYVIDVPIHSLDAVPIQIACHNLMVNGEKGFDNSEDFKHLWQKALQVVEFAKNRPPNTTKYQQNLSVATGGSNK